MLFLFALSCLAAATFGSVVVYQRGVQKRLAHGVDAVQALPPAPEETKRKGKGQPSIEAEPTLETLAPGDIIVDGVDDWLVAGSIGYREEREAWQLHLLEDGARHRFLEVRTRNGSAEVAFVDEVKDLPTFGSLLQGLTYRGQSFQLDARGDARTTTTGDVGVRGAGQLKYARYSGAGGALLLVEEEGAARRAYTGARVPPSSLSIMSGELNRQS